MAASEIAKVRVNACALYLRERPGPGPVRSDPTWFPLLNVHTLPVNGGALGTHKKQVAGHGIIRCAQCCRVFSRVGSTSHASPGGTGIDAVDADGGGVAKFVGKDLGETFGPEFGY